MSKFKIRMKLQGLELEMEGTRDDIPVISQSIGEQITGLFKPMGTIVEGEVSGSAALTPAPQIDPPKRARKRKATSQSDHQQKSSDAVNFRHDPSKYGMPSQEWNPTHKSIWLLYIVKEQNGPGELSAGVIAKTFNQHFKQAGLIRGSNVSRDLGKAKLVQPALVGEESTQNPSKWFLTDEGDRRAQSLIAEALSPSP